MELSTNTFTTDMKIIFILTLTHAKQNIICVIIMSKLVLEPIQFIKMFISVIIMHKLVLKPITISQEFDDFIS